MEFKKFMHNYRFAIFLVFLFFILISPEHSGIASTKEEITAFKIPEKFQTIMYIGGNSQYQNIQDALQSIPENAGDVIFYIRNGISISGIYQIPDDKGITSFTLDSETKSIIQCENCNFIASGIPLIIGENITLTKMHIYGGGFANYENNSIIENSLVIVLGTVGYAYGGGYALDEGVAEVNRSLIAVFGNIQYNIYGGGYSVGKNSESNVNQSAVYVGERATVGENIYYGGYAASKCVEIPPTRRQIKWYSYDVVEQDCGKDGGTVSVSKTNANILGRIKGNIIENDYVMKGAYGKSGKISISQNLIKNIPVFVENNEVEKVQTIILAPGQVCDTLVCAMEKVDKDTTELNIILTHNSVEHYSIMIPYSGYNLKKVVITAESPVKVSFDKNNFFANGIDFTLDKNVTFTDMQLYAGGVSTTGKSEIIKHASVTIKGTVEELYGGSLVNNDRSYSEVNSTNILITGTILKNVYCGGFASGKGAKSNVGSVDVTLGKTGTIHGNLSFGGYAQNICVQDAKGNKDCNHAGYTYTRNVNAAIYGKVNGLIRHSGMEANGANSEFGSFRYVLANDESLMDLSDPQIILIGPGENLKTLQQGFQAIHYPGNNVIFNISGNLVIDDSIEIPTYLGIKSLKLDSNRVNVPRSLNFNYKDFFANGIQLTIGKDIVFQNSYLYGGTHEVYGNKNSRLPTELIIDGYVDTVFMGGKAEGMGKNRIGESNVDIANLTLSGTIRSSLFAGGNAIGGGITYLDKATINILTTGKIYKNLYAYGLASSKINETSENLETRCFNSLELCEQYATTDACKSGYKHNRWSLYDASYCVSINLTIEYNRSLSSTGSVSIINEGVVQGHIICNAQQENNGGISTVDLVTPENICAIR